ncbi:MAG: TolC family protein [Candidatus Thiodiazotropha sp. (ex Epidulcina cf. delphinae)]|nr:TolC family protein [Candidatus Thiodiazotropha sp. (ex Epidulcina cf. delphinae)]
MNNHLRLLAATVLGLGAFGQAAALSLPEVVEAAVQRHPDRQLESAERGLADAIRRKADQPLAADPSITLKHETDAIGSGQGQGFREWEGGAELPLWWPGQPDTYRREADRTQDAADAMTRARRLDIAGEVRERLWRLELARNEHGLAESALSVARQLADDVTRRVNAGELPRSDSVLIQRDLLARVDALEQASSRLSEARSLFIRYTGTEANEPGRTETESPARELPADHPALLKAEATVSRARAHRDRVKADRRAGPNLWLGARSEKPAAGVDYDSFVAAQISLPFGSEAHAGPDMAQAEAELIAAMAARERVRVGLEEALTSAVLALDRTRGARQRSQRRQVLAEESLKLSRRAFELGETDLVRLLQAQDAAISGRYDTEIRAIEHARAVARLNQALGVVPQ